MFIVHNHSRGGTGHSLVTQSMGASGRLLACPIVDQASLMHMIEVQSSVEDVWHFTNPWWNCVVGISWWWWVMLVVCIWRWCTRDLGHMCWLEFVRWRFLVLPPVSTNHASHSWYSHASGNKTAIGIADSRREWVGKPKVKECSLEPTLPKALLPHPNLSHPGRGTILGVERHRPGCW